VADEAGLGLRTGVIDPKGVMDTLSQILWRERDLLDSLLFRLAEERLVRASGHRHWQWRATDEVDRVLEQIREVELLRAIAADEVATRIGLPAGSSLLVLAAAVDEPWRTILLDHHEAIGAMSAAIAEGAPAESRRSCRLGQNPSLTDFLS
jgi:hypothetical protein